MSNIVKFEQVKDKIIVLRGEQVMLDFQLAQLYGVETRVLKQAVNRNIERFPEDFIFRLTKDESNSLIYMGSSQIVIPSEIPKSSKSQNESSGLCRYGSKIRGRRETQETIINQTNSKQYK